MSRRLLIVTHAPSPNTERLAAAVTAGAGDPAIEDVHVERLDSRLADAAGVQRADALVLGTTENFGDMAGLTKDFFERIYYPCLDRTQGLAWALYVRAGNDGSGARRSIERIVTGLGWRAAIPPLVLSGEFDEVFVERCRELGMTMAAGLEAGIY